MKRKSVLPEPVSNLDGVIYAIHNGWWYNWEALDWYVRNAKLTDEEKLEINKQLSFLAGPKKLMDKAKW